MVRTRRSCHCRRRWPGDVSQESPTGSAASYLAPDDPSPALADQTTPTNSVA